MNKNDIEIRSVSTAISAASQLVSQGYSVTMVEHPDMFLTNIIIWKEISLWKENRVHQMSLSVPWAELYSAFSNYPELSKEFRELRYKRKNIDDNILELFKKVLKDKGSKDANNG
jgi:hypothetical protein